MTHRDERRVEPVPNELIPSVLKQYAAGSGGSGKPFYWQQQYAFSVDDLNVTAPRQVPDAGATLFLLGLGLLGLGGIRWHARAARNDPRK